MISNALSSASAVVVRGLVRITCLHTCAVPELRPYSILDEKTKIGLDESVR